MVISRSGPDRRELIRSRFPLRNTSAKSPGESEALAGLRFTFFLMLPLLLLPARRMALVRGD
jgi:hypothetical protein